MTDIPLFEALYTARSLRRLKSDPVPDDLLTRVLDAGTRAGSGGNAQNWGFVVVRDPEQRRRLGAIYRKGSDVSAAVYAARGRPAHLSQQEYDRFMSAGAYLWDHMSDAPVLLAPCVGINPLPPRASLPPGIQVRYAELEAYQERIRGASIYPAVQNIILACRALGLATLITTNHLYCESEFKELLGIPESMFPCALMPIGWPTGSFGPVRRKPLSEVVFAERWGVPRDS